MQTIYLANIGSLRFSAKPNALIGFVLLASLFAFLALWLVRLSPTQSIIAGLAAALIHYVSEVIHQFGHAAAARRTGHPMKGVRFWWILGQSLYPSDEGELPARIHIQRALGGPIISLALTAVTGAVTLLLYPLGGLAYDLALFAFVDNLLFYTIGSLLPLGFTDGSTLVRYMGKP